MKQNKEKKKGLLKLLGVFVFLCVTTASVTGIVAYFTDRENATNTFTIGNVDITLTEPNWDEDKASAVVPNAIIAKDPTVTNVGDNPAFVFLEVKVPYAKVVTATSDGSKITAADKELFTYAIKSGWTEIGNATKDTTNKVVTHIYAYGTTTTMTTLPSGAKTSALFDNVSFINVVEGQGLEDTTVEINIVAKAIQTSNLQATNPSAILSIINNQSK